MTNPDYTAVYLLIDVSGSMTRIKAATEEGINAFIQSQATESLAGRRTIRLATFSDRLDDPGPSRDAVNIPEFTLVPDASTALLDGIGGGILNFGAELYRMPEDQRPGTVIFAIMTDGAENSSRNWTLRKVNEEITHHESTYGWQFLYMGANQDAIAVAADLGIAKGRSMTYAANDQGTHAVTRSLNEYAVAAAASAAPVEFTDEQRLRATGLDR